MTRYQTRAALYNTVLEQPILLQTIAQSLNPKDLVNLKLSGYSEECRFQDTLGILLQERLQEAEAHKREFFIRTLNDLINYHDSQTELYDQLRSLRDIYDYLMDNIWFREIIPSLDRVVEQKLIEFARNEQFCSDAVYYLAEMYGIFVYAEFDENNDDDMLEFVIDTQQQKHYI